LKKLIKTTSEERLAICEACDYHSNNRKNYKTIRPDVHCTNCGCTLAPKTKCLSCNCPLSKWVAIVTADEEDKMKKDGK